MIASFPSLPLAAETRGGVVLLHRRGATQREAPLFDALRIYTRDLGLSATMGPDAPATLSSEDLLEVASYARQEGAEVVVWFGGENDRPALFALRVATNDLRATEVTGDDLDGAARTLALKVRTLLTPGVSVEERVWTPVAETPATPKPPEAVSPPAPPRVAPPPTAAPALPPPGATAPSAAPASAPAAGANAVVAAAPSVGRPPAWLEATAAYQIGGPPDSTWLRQGLSIRLAVPLRRYPVAPFLDVAATNRPSSMTSAGTIEVSDVPIGLGLAARWRRSRLLLDFGPRASLHVLSVSGAATDGRPGAATRYTAGVGGLIGGVYFLTDRLGIAATFIAEALLPRREFDIDHRLVADLGAADFSGSAGLLFVVP